MGDDIVGRGQAGIPGSDGASPYLRRDPFEISRFRVNHDIPPRLVRDTGFEPVTPTVSR
jgi:hypothetical protein